MDDEGENYSDSEELLKSWIIESLKMYKIS